MKFPTIFFCHIPKTGGVALRYYFQNQYAVQKICPTYDWRKFLQAEPSGLSQYSLFQGHYPLDLARFLPTAQRIAFLREPVARTVSLLMHIRRDSNFHPLHHVAFGKTIEQMLDVPELLVQIANQQTAYLGSRMMVPASDIAAKSVVEFGSDVGEVLTEPDINLAIENLRQLDFLGLTEQMDESLWRLSDRYGFHPVMNFGKRNEASNADAHCYDELSARTIERIRAVNDLDIQLYDAARAIFAQSSVAPRYDHLVRQSLSNREKDGNTFFGTYDLAGFMPGSNWYEAERDGPSADAFRWSGPLDVSTIELPLNAQQHRTLELRLFPANGEDVTSTVEVHCDDNTLLPSQSQFDECIEYRVPLVPNRTATERGFHQVTFTHRCLRTRTNPAGDLRNIRFGLSSLRVLPMD